MKAIIVISIIMEEIFTADSRVDSQLFPITFEEKCKKLISKCDIEYKRLYIFFIICQTFNDYNNFDGQ